MPASGDLGSTFDDAIKDFNNAYNIKDYRDFRQYLHPVARIVIQKVDDPGEFVAGTIQDVMKYLNNEEANPGDNKALFPQLLNYKRDDHPKERQNRKGEVVGDVIGTGSYQDKHDDPKNQIPVHFCLRFKKHQGVWHLVAAFVWPI